MTPGNRRGPASLVMPVLRRGVIVVGVLVLAGCGGTSVGRNGADGATGDDGVDGSHVLPGAEGADGRSYPDGDAVTGSGRVVSRSISVAGVTTLQIGATFDVQVRTGEPEQATIRMDDNLTDLVEATVVGDELRLGLKPGASVRNASLSAEITLASLARLTARGASDVRLATEIVAEQLQVDASGASRVAGVLRLDQTLASASGASTLELSGDIGRLELSGSGTSGIRAPGLTVRDLDAELSGVSCATMAVSETLSARASGVSALRYRGTPQINRHETSGLSSIAPDAGGCGA